MPELLGSTAAVFIRSAVVLSSCTVTRVGAARSNDVHEVSLSREVLGTLFPGRMVCRSATDVNHTNEGIASDCGPTLTE